MPPRLHDVRWFVRRLAIVDREGRVSTLAHLTPEQDTFIQAWMTYRNICVVKPRQLGFTTIASACHFHEGYTAPDPVGTLTMTHESGACTRVNMMFRQFVMGLPRPLRPPLARDNMAELELGHNGAVFRQYMAGGRGQGRSFTYQMLHATEMAFWPQGSASVKGGQNADRDAWASVLATMHDGPYRRITVESTGDGPTGMFFDIVKTARESPEWAFLFFRWFDFHQYAIDPPSGWGREKEEEELAGRIAQHLQIPADHPDIDRKLAWRRSKLIDEAYSMTRFNREYPETWMQPFLLSDSTWFAGQVVNAMLARLPRDGRTGYFDGPLRVYHEPEEGRAYFIGGDTCGGTGRDYGVFVVLRDDYEVAAVWSSNIRNTYEQGLACAKLSATYHGALTLIERNNYGDEVIRHVESLGTPTWKDEKGDDFWTQGGPAGQTKKMIYGYARHLVNDQLCCSVSEDAPVGINDEEILKEMLTIREDSRGRIEAPEGDHDDHADAYVLALWCGRWHYQRATKPIDLHRVRRALIERARQVR